MSQTRAPATRSLDELVAEIDRETERAGLPRAVRSASSLARAKLGSQVKHIVFSLGETDYAISMANVLEVQRPPAVTPIPNVPDWVLGVTNLRGDIISIVDLRGFLGMEVIPQRASSRVIVGRALREELVTGLLVDRVIGIRSLRMDRISEPTLQADDRLLPYISGFHEANENLFVVLDIEQLLLSSEMKQFEPV